MKQQSGSSGLYQATTKISKVRPKQRQHQLDATMAHLPATALPQQIASRPHKLHKDPLPTAIVNMPLRLTLHAIQQQSHASWKMSSASLPQSPSTLAIKPSVSEWTSSISYRLVVCIKCPVGEGHWSQGVLSKNVCHKPLSIRDIKADATAADVKTPQQTLKGPLIRLKNTFSQFLPYRWNCSFDFMRFMDLSVTKQPSHS